MTGVTGVLCAGSLTLLEDNRSVATLKCPLDGSVYNKSQYLGEVCSTCQLCKLGEDVLGLNILLEADAQPSETGDGGMMPQTLDSGAMGSNDLFI